jgi:hypothetical protein
MPIVSGGGGRKRRSRKELGNEGSRKEVERGVEEKTREGMGEGMVRSATQDFK